MSSAQKLVICIVFSMSVFFSSFCVSNPEEKNLFTEEEFNLIKNKSESIQSDALIKLQQTEINSRDYRSFKTADCFRIKSNASLDRAKKYLTSNLERYNQTLRDPTDFYRMYSLSKKNDCRLEALILGFKITSYFAFSLPEGKDRGYDVMPKSVFTFGMLKKRNAESVRSYMSLMVEGVNKRVGGVTPDSDLPDNIADFVINRLWKKISYYFSIWVENIIEAELHIIHKVIVYAIVNVSRDIASQIQYDWQVSTLNMALILPCSDGELRLFVAQSGNILSYLYNSGTCFLGKEANQPLDNKNAGESFKLLMSPHTKPSSQFLKTNITPFGGQVVDGAIEFFGLDGAHYKSHCYRLIAGKSTALAITSNPEVVTAILKPGDIIVQATAAEHICNQAKKIFNILRASEDSFLGSATTLSELSKSEKYGSTISLTVIRQ